MESAINDGAYHHVKVVKDGQRLRVYVDDVKCLEHTFEETEVFFAKGHVGIGLWDGALDVQNFFVHPLENPFTDVPEDSFYIDPVLWAVEEGITSGTTATTFHPGGVCVRAQVVTFLWRAAGSPEPDSAVNPFVDVAMDEYYCKAVMWAYEQGITAGMDETHFAPSAECTRAQVVTFLWRYLGQPQPTVTGHPFTDVAEDQFCFVPMLWAVENGITSGMTATTFAPNAICNRAQVVTFLYRAFAD